MRACRHTSHLPTAPCCTAAPACLLIRLMATSSWTGTRSIHRWVGGPIMPGCQPSSCGMHAPCSYLHAPCSHPHVARMHHAVILMRPACTMQSSSCDLHASAVILMWHACICSHPHLACMHILFRASSGGRFTLHPAPCTLHPAPRALYPAPHNLGGLR